MTPAMIRTQRSLGLIYGLTALTFAYATALLIFSPVTIRFQLPERQAGYVPWPELLLTVVVILFVVSAVWTWHNLAAAVTLGRVAVWLGWALHLCILAVVLLQLLIDYNQWAESLVVRSLLEIAASFGVVLLGASYGLPLFLLCVATLTTRVVHRRLGTTSDH